MRKRLNRHNISCRKPLKSHIKGSVKRRAWAVPSLGLGLASKIRCQINHKQRGVSLGGRRSACKLLAEAAHTTTTVERMRRVKVTLNAEKGLGFRRCFQQKLSGTQEFTMEVKHDNIGSHHAMLDPSKTIETMKKRQVIGMP